MSDRLAEIRAKVEDAKAHPHRYALAYIGADYIGADCDVAWLLAEACWALRVILMEE